MTVIGTVSPADCAYLRLTRLVYPSAQRLLLWMSSATQLMRFSALAVLACAVTAVTARPVPDGLAVAAPNTSPSILLLAISNVLNGNVVKITNDILSPRRDILGLGGLAGAIGGSAIPIVSRGEGEDAGGPGGAGGSV
ncbi:hypothetical protein FIBSPDRAFT_970741 [Athelia psychrophila]|uniref:Uncharacterized protein n=1 Tax=Athelia psychrophila TaxID=1759441 RepID=A0A167SJ27_9AGAM|nr:hypothetical protein FIBSPDRAFT_970741 [Fibularhizoctonia sp. CBS 109695]